MGDCKICAFGNDDDSCFRMISGGLKSCFVPIGCLWIKDEEE